MISQAFIEEMRKKLLSSKDQLEAELAELHAHTEMGDDLDSNVDELQVDEASRDVIKRLTADLEKIEVALQKVEEGTYGTDDDGNEISEERLRVLPWADKAV